MPYGPHSTARGAGERVDPGLGRGHVRLHRRALHLERRGDVHDVAAVLAQPRVERRLRHVVGAEQVDVDDGLEPVGRDRRHRRREVAGRVVHHDVELAVVRDQAVDDALHRAGVAHVAGVEPHVDALGLELGLRRLERLLLAAGDGDAGAVVAEAAADLLADAGGAAGDEHHLAGEEIGANGDAGASLMRRILAERGPPALTATGRGRPAPRCIRPGCRRGGGRPWRGGRWR